jgi:hypothetical protein
MVKLTLITAALWATLGTFANQLFIDPNRLQYLSYVQSLFTSRHVGSEMMSVPCASILPRVTSYLSKEAGTLIAS